MMFFERNLLKISYILVFLGTVGLLINISDILPGTGILFFSFLFLFIPPLYVIVFRKTEIINSINIYLLILIPLIIINYCYFIKIGAPVGYNDVHDHLIQTINLFDDNGKIIYQNCQKLSYYFVALYIFTDFIIQTCNWDIISIVMLIPPLFTLLIITSVYIIIKRIHNQRIAALAMMFFGWENLIIVFGHEYRTQTIGVLFLYFILFLLIPKKNPSEDNPLLISFLLITFLSALVTTSFVVDFSSFIIFCGMILPAFFFKYIGWEKTELKLTVSLFFLFILLYFVYFIYAFGGIANVLPAQMDIVDDYISYDSSNVKYDVSNIKGTGNEIYGSYVKISVYLFWILFIISNFIYFIYSLKNKRVIQTTVFFGFNCLFSFTIITSIAGILTPERTYVITFIFMSLVSSFSLIKLSDHFQSPKNGFYHKFVIIFIILFILTGSTIKLPQYILGDTTPFRGEEPIDLTVIWASYQSNLNEFISSYVRHSNIHLHVMVVDYQMPLIIDRNYLTKTMSITPHKNINRKAISINDIIILQDKRHNTYYTDRYTLPKTVDYYNYNQICSSGDYFAFISNI